MNKSPNKSKENSIKENSDTMNEPEKNPSDFYMLL